MFWGIIQVGLAAAAVGLGNNPSDSWQLRATLYWVQVVYGLLSAPFLLFKLPLMGNLLTHANPPAYK